MKPIDPEMEKNDGTSGQQQPPPDTDNENKIAQINFKPPPFWKANPVVWFHQVEAYFSTFNIKKDATRFNYIVAAIDSSVLNQVSDCIISPPEVNKFENLKSRLIATFGDTATQKLKKLLGEVELGDKRPSHLFREMAALAGANFDKNLLKTLWLQRLPSQLQSILSISEEPVEKLIMMADKICEVSAPDVQIAHLQAITRTSNASGSGSNASNSTNQVDLNGDLHQQIRNLTKQVAELTSRFDIQNQFRPRNRSRSNYRSTSSGRSNSFKSRSPHKQNVSNESATNRSGQCWYHRKFGGAATRCTKPCSFPNGLKAEN